MFLFVPAQIKNIVKCKYDRQINRPEARISENHQKRHKSKQHCRINAVDTALDQLFGADSCCQLCQNQNEEKDDQRFQKNLFAKQRVGLQGFLLRQRLHYIPDSTGDQADQCPPSALFGKQNCRRYHRQNQKRRPRKHFPIREVLLVLVQRVHIMNAAQQNTGKRRRLQPVHPLLCQHFFKRWMVFAATPRKKHPGRKCKKQSDSKSVHDQVVRFASKCPAPIDLPEQNCRAHSNQRSGCHPVDKAPCDFIVEFWLFRTQIYRSKDKSCRCNAQYCL